MSVKIRLTRTGRKNLPAYRIAVFDTRTRRDGPALEVVGWYNPLSREAGKGFRVETDRLEHWIRNGALPTLAVTELLDRQGVKLPAAPAAPAKTAKPKAAAAKAKAPSGFGKTDPRRTELRKRKLARRASRVALKAKKAAGTPAPAAAAAPAPAGKQE